MEPSVPIKNLIYKSVSKKQSLCSGWMNCRRWAVLWSVCRWNVCEMWDVLLYMGVCGYDCWTHCEKRSKYQALISNSTALAEDDMHPFTLQTCSLKYFPHLFFCLCKFVCVHYYFCVLDVQYVRISVCSWCLSENCNCWDVYWGTGMSRVSGEVIKSPEH